MYVLYVLCLTLRPILCEKHPDTFHAKKRRLLDHFSQRNAFKVQCSAVHSTLAKFSEKDLIFKLVRGNKEFFFTFRFLKNAMCLVLIEKVDTLQTGFMISFYNFSPVSHYIIYPRP